MATHVAEDGVSIYYEDFGNGVPVVFVPGGNETHAMWEEQVAALAPGCRTITFDWRGTGRSDRPRGGFTADAVVDDLISLVESVVATSVILVGHGLGGHIVLLAAKARPDLVSALVLVDSGPWFSGQRDGVSGGLATKFVEENAGSNSHMAYADTLAKMTDMFLFKDPVSSELRMSLIMQQLEWPLHVIDSYVVNMNTIDHRNFLGRILKPTVIMHGRFDRKQVLNGAYVLQKAIPGSRLIIFDDSAHCPHLEESQRFNTELKQLIETVEKSASKCTG